MQRSLHALAPEGKLTQKLQSKGLEALLKDGYDLSLLRNDRLYKIRLIYDADSIINIEAEPYNPMTIKGYFLHEVDKNFNYEHKYLDRSCLNPYHVVSTGSSKALPWATTEEKTALKETPKKDYHGSLEGLVPIFVREGLITDTSFTNIVLKIGGELITPQKALLKGVMREQLLAEGIIKCGDLTVEDLSNCEAIYLINAMLPLERAIKLNP